MTNDEPIPLVMGGQDHDPDLLLADILTTRPVLIVLGIVGCVGAAVAAGAVWR